MGLLGSDPGLEATGFGESAGLPVEPILGRPPGRRGPFVGFGLFSVVPELFETTGLLSLGVLGNKPPDPPNAGIDGIGLEVAGFSPDGLVDGPDVLPLAAASDRLLERFRSKLSPARLGRVGILGPVGRIPGREGSPELPVPKLFPPKLGGKLVKAAAAVSASAGFV